MTKTQAERLLALADSVEKATDYDQNLCSHCALVHIPEELGRSATGPCCCDPIDEYYGLSSPQHYAIFGYDLSDVQVTATGKAAQIREIANQILT